MSEQQTKHRAACASRLVQFDAESGEAVNCGLPCDCDNPARWVTVPVGEPTPPATPQPETLLDVPHAEVDALVEAIYAERRAFSPPPDVERLTREAFRAGFLAVCRKKSDDTPLDMLTRVWTFDGVAAADLESEAYAAWRALSPSTPGEPT